MKSADYNIQFNALLKHSVGQYMYKCSYFFTLVQHGYADTVLVWISKNLHLHVVFIDWEARIHTRSSGPLGKTSDFLCACVRKCSHVGLAK